MRAHPKGQRHPDPVRRRSGPTRLLVAVLCVGTGVSLAACSGGTNASSSTSVSSAPKAGSDAITIHNFAFSPDTLTVMPGATVTVTNQDEVAHTVTADKGAFSTGDILPSQSKTFTAPSTPGTYAYMCSIHQYMTGTLNVSG